MSTKQRELLNTQMNVNEPPNLNGTGKTDNGQEDGDRELIDREKIDGTPFWVEGTQEKGYYLRMGSHRLTIEELKTKEAAIEYINYNMYDLLLKMVLAVMADRDEIEGLTEETELKTKRLRTTVGKMVAEGINTYIKSQN